MESLTYLKNLKVTPKKMRMLRDLIVKKAPEDALDYLQYSTSKAAHTYYKVLQSAIANATQLLKVRPDMLQFKLLTIEEGRRLKRFNAGSKGMAKPMVRRFSHVKVILVESTKEQASKGTKKLTIKQSKEQEIKGTSEQKSNESKDQEIKKTNEQKSKEPKKKTTAKKASVKKVTK